jgi:DNA repair exonuclease SbcCD ATPase subunit
MNTILKQEITTLKDTIRENSSAIELENRMVEVQTENLKRMEKGNQDFIEKHQKDINKLTTEISEQNSNIELYRNSIGQLSGKTINFDKNTKKQKEAEKIDSKLHSKETTLNREVNFYDEHDECPTCDQDIDVTFKINKKQVLHEKLTEVNDARKDIQKLLDQVNNNIEKDNKIFSEVQKLNIEIGVLETKISASNQIIKTLDENISDLSKKEDLSKVMADIEKAQKSLELLTTQKEQLLTDSEIQKIANSLLKDSGIKTLIIKQYLPIMNNLINKYLASMDFFVNFHLDESFNETIKSRHRDEFSYESFSEGEKMRIDLALLFTWRTIAKLKNSTNTNLLILDEVFDSSLDDAGTQEFLKILYTLGKDQNVFVISHKGDVLQDKFNNIVKFEKIKGFSRIT